MLGSRQSNPDFSSGIFFFILGIVICCFSWKLNLGDPSKPGPGFMPFFAGALLFFFSLMLLIRLALSEPSGSWDIQFRWGNFLSAVIAMGAYAFFLEKVGFVLVTFAFILFLMKWTGQQAWGKALMAGVITAATSYLLFETFLQTMLPRTFLGIF